MGETANGKKRTGDFLDLGAEGAVEAASLDFDQGHVPFPREVCEADELVRVLDVDGEDERVRAEVL